MSCHRCFFFFMRCSASVNRRSCTSTLFWNGVKKISRWTMRCSCTGSGGCSLLRFVFGWAIKLATSCQFSLKTFWCFDATKITKHFIGKHNESRNIANYCVLCAWFRLVGTCHGAICCCFLVVFGCDLSLSRSPFCRLRWYAYLFSFLGAQHTWLQGFSLFSNRYVDFGATGASWLRPMAVFSSRFLLSPSLT